MTVSAHPAAVRDAQDLRHHPAVAELLEHGDHPDPVAYRDHYTRLAGMFDGLTAALARARTAAADRDIDNGHLHAALTTIRDGNVRRLSSPPLDPQHLAALNRARARQPARLHPADCPPTVAADLYALGLIEPVPRLVEAHWEDDTAIATLTAEGWLA